MSHVLKEDLFTRLVRSRTLNVMRASQGLFKVLPIMICVLSSCSTTRSRLVIGTEVKPQSIDKYINKLSADPVSGEF
jgi:hypothetical protein